MSEIEREREREQRERENREREREERDRARERERDRSCVTKEQTTEQEARGQEDQNCKTSARQRPRTSSLVIQYTNPNIMYTYSVPDVHITHKYNLIIIQI